MKNRMLWVIALTVLCGGMAFGQGSADDPGERDTLYIGSAIVDPGQKAIIEINFNSLFVWLRMPIIEPPLQIA